MWLAPRLILALLACALPLAAGQQHAGWQRLDAGAVRELAHSAPGEVLERNGGQLWIEGGRLMRRFRKDERELGCTLAGGPGQLFALAPDPYGLTFVAAGAGLFVSSPESEVIDRVRLADGAPRSAPSSLAFDAKRRLWLASDSEFGVLEPSHFFGRTLRVPAPGPYRILASLAGSIELACGAELWSYRPDAGQQPELKRVLRAAAPLSSGDQVEINLGESLGLTIEAEAAGGAVTRYAVDGSHVWSLFEDLGADLEPGEHLIELVAMDRDLNLSPVFELQVRVRYPFYYQSWFVLSLAGVLGLTVLLSFYLRARRAPAELRPAARPALVRSLLSTLLLLVIGLQMLAGAIPHGRGWPFIGYSMYTTSRDVGHIAYNGAIVGLGKRGIPLDIPLGIVGKAADNRWQLLRPIMEIRGAKDGRVPEALLQRYNQKHPDWEQVERLQVWAKRSLIGAQGPIEIAPLILSDYRGGQR